MGAVSELSSFLEYQDMVGMPNGTDPLGDDDGGDIGYWPGPDGEGNRFCSPARSRNRPDQDFRIAGQSTGNEEALLLAAA